MTDRTQLTVEAFERLLILSHQVEVSMDRLLRQDQLTAKQFQMIATIEKKFTSPPSIMDVAQEIGTSHQNIKQLALQLEKRGYLEILRDETDRRVLRLRLTEKNAEYWKSKAPEHLRFMMGLFTSLDDRELEGFNASLIKAIAALK
jgi:DNA-binding MarR family transcriptional regulator